MSSRAFSTYVDLKTGADPEAHVGKIEAERRAGQRCTYADGDRVRVMDFREDAHNYNGTVVGNPHETAHYGWMCTIERDDGKGRVRKGTAKLKRIQTRRPAGSAAKRPARA